MLHDGGVKRFPILRLGRNRCRTWHEPCDCSERRSGDDALVLDHESRRRRPCVSLCASSQSHGTHFAHRGSGQRWSRAVIVALITYLNPLRMLAKLPINLDNLVVSGTKVTMEQPRLSGFTSDARAYELTADTAAQDMTKPDIIELHNIHAKVQMQDKSTMELNAATGLYDAKAETLRLDRDIVLNSSTGYQGRLSEALVDIRKGNVISEHPVEVRLLQGT